MSDPLRRTVGYCVFHGGLDGIVFVNPGDNRPYLVFQREDDSTHVDLVEVSKMRCPDLSSSLKLIWDYVEYDPLEIRADTPPSWTVDQERVRQVKLRRVEY